MKNGFSSRLNNALPLIFLVLGIAFGACVIVFANSNTETLIAHRTFPSGTVPVDETTNGAFYGQGVYGAAIVSAACFICAALTASRRYVIQGQQVTT
ncbi:hypothetical protein [Aridibaculum aurantiacum]|uniref:hypothetical protein n=1 Tax=Aridibaculum aurantiacum TaxID=2810307 RepID=UPI001A957E24|nr:hypothetical protein [Aridibaculum aurantiacum]